MKILIGTPIHQMKDYAMEKWLENVSKLEFPADFLMVDNSPGLDYVKKVKGYCEKYGIKKYKITHIKVSQGIIGEETQERIAKAQEKIRQEVLLKDYDAWFSWESDIIIPVNALDKLIGFIKGGIMVVVHNSWMRRHPGFADFDMGCTLISRKALEKYEFFPKQGLDFWQFEDDLYKLRVLKGGGNFVEVYGLISPIYHLDDESRLIKQEDQASLSNMPLIDNKIEGWMDNKDLLWLFNMAKEMDTIVEIGSWKGRSTHALLSGCKGTVFAVDHFLGSIAERKNNHAEAQIRDISKDFMENVGSFKNLQVLKMDNAEAVKHFENNSIDMIFIDAGHTYREVLGDITRWLPKAKKIICGHDIDDQQVEKAVREMFGNEFERNEGDMWIKRIS